MRRSVLLLLSVCLLSAGTAPSILAQAPANPAAVLVFEVDPERLRESGMLQEPEGFAKNALTKTIPAGKIELSELSRIHGAVSAPTDLQSLKNMAETETLPMEMFIQIQFKSAELAEKAFEQAKSRGVPTTIAGQQFFAVPPNQKAPTNMLVHRYSQDTIEIGTQGFLTSPNREFVKDKLAVAWPQMPTAAIRMAFDLDGVRHLIDYEAMSNSVVAHPAILIVKETSVVRLGVDFSGDTLLWLSFRSEDAETAHRIETVLDSQLITLKNVGAQAISRAGPEMQKPVQAILDSMDSNVDENDVNLVIPNPPGLMDALDKAFPFLGIAN
ncbi:hypothetical protein Poly51_26460 [Rubripirellula tenax]|uniref:Uncharacterized protein n=1 Tax=Rubripirellula tenax TaxID=2528015 RepID=A0A5C6FAT3_9BACT|nr:hypothetical protein [Rubripirellula tenax]TWU56729.1 hypothetical protein Poly51_26460 [Rubripirellula tenax]